MGEIGLIGLALPTIGWTTFLVSAIVIGVIAVLGRKLKISYNKEKGLVLELEKLAKENKKIKSEVKALNRENKSLSNLNMSLEKDVNDCGEKPCIGFTALTKEINTKGSTLRTVKKTLKELLKSKKA